MSILEGFKILNRASGNPIMSITRNGISFSKATIAKIGYPAYVHLMVDDSTNRVALVPCEEDIDSIAFVKEGMRPNFIRWNNKDLINRLLGLCNLKLTSDFKGIRIDSEYFPDENVLIFEMDKYKVIENDDESNN